MCRELKIETGLDTASIETYMRQYKIDGKIAWHDLQYSEGYNVVTIDTIDDVCFCNINIEQKRKVFDFIHAISS